MYLQLTTFFGILCALAMQDGADPRPIDDMKRHPFLFAGAWDMQNPMISLKQVSDGSIIFSENRLSYTKAKVDVVAATRKNGTPTHVSEQYVPDKSPGRVQAYEDVTMQSTGLLVMALTSSAMAIYPGRSHTWYYSAPASTEIHSIQTIAKDRVLVMQNGTPAKALIFDTKQDRLLKEIVIPTNVKAAHDMFRHVRMTRTGTLLVPHLAENKVCEYDMNGKLIWSVTAPSPWHAERLANGNTLIAGDWHHYAREVNPKGRIVWEFSQKDMPGVPLGNIHTASRLANGNTILSFWFKANQDTLNWPGRLQMLELTQDKKPVWAISSWQTAGEGGYLGPPNTIQLIDQAVPDENVYIEK